MNIYENIRKLRENAGLSQGRLAEMVGYKDRSSIAKVEAGLVDLSQSKIAAFAAALNVSPAELMGLTDKDGSPAEFKDRLNQALKDKDMKASELSRLTGIGEGAISQYRKGAYKASQEKLELLARALNVPIAWLMGADVSVKSSFDIFSDPRILPIEKKKIPLLGGVACGEPVFHEELESYVEASTNVKADFAMKAIGDSMVNIGIKDGYIVFIRQQPSVDNGEVAAVNIDGEFTLKRVYDYGNILVLRAENPDFPDMEYREGDADNIVILGKAVAFQGDVK
jgi:repressor LexA